MILQYGRNSQKSSEIENCIFQKANNKSEYLDYIARFIIHLRERSKYFLIINTRNSKYPIFDSETFPCGEIKYEFKINTLNLFVGPLQILLI